ncbi:MAG: GNAT family N-acetyltransferase [Leifsonia sp.]
MTTELRHEPAQSRYTFWIDDDEVGLADYRLHDGTIDIVHTEIEPARRGDGLGAEMVEGVLDDIRRSGSGPVIATCPFVAAFISNHVEYEELLVH